MMGDPSATEQASDFDEEQLYLFAVRIDPDADAPELFTLFVYGDDDRPLTVDDRILFFTTPDLGERALAVAGLSERFPDGPPREVAMTCDIATALYLVEQSDEDTDSALLDCISTLLDMVAATGLAIPERHRAVLHAIADHLTFDRDLTSCFDEATLPRIAAQDALLWSLGAITVRARVIG